MRTQTPRILLSPAKTRAKLYRRDSVTLSHWVSRLNNRRMELAGTCSSCESPLQNKLEFQLNSSFPTSRSGREAVARSLAPRASVRSA